jgi:hypothetical protein
MHKEQGIERIVLWSAMVASLKSCFGCPALLCSASRIGGFCHDCVERSQRCQADELGGEA